MRPFGKQERLSIIGDSMASILAAQPQIAVSVLKDLGYTVIPPDAE